MSCLSLVLVIAVLVLIWRSQWFKDLFTPADTVEDHRVLRSARIAASVALVLAVVLLASGGRVATWRPSAESDLFDVVVLLRLALARLALVCAVWPLVVFGGYATWEWFDNKAGKRLWQAPPAPAALLGLILVAMAVLASGIIR